MNPCEELREKLINDLQVGVSYVVNSERKYVSYREILKSYCVNTIPRKVFLDKYKQLPGIEVMPHEEKIEWKKFVNEVFPQTTPEFRLDAVKIIYTISILSEKHD